MLCYVSTERDKWVSRQVNQEDSAEPNLVASSESGQQWLGFGGCFNELGAQALETLDQSVRKAMLDELFSPEGALRLSFNRVPIGANDFALDWYSLNETPGDFEMKNFSIQRDRSCLIPYIRQAQTRCPEMKLFASPWSPPIWLKHPPLYNYGTLIADDRYQKAYALYFIKFVQEYAREGIRIDHVYMQNEPTADQKLPSCCLSPDQIRRFIGEYLAPAFKQAGLDCDIWLGTLNPPEYDRYLLPMLMDERLLESIGGVGIQWAGRALLARLRASFPQLPVVQTENECGDGKNDWSHAMHVAELLREYIANGVCAYAYWHMILGDPASTWGWPQNSMITILDAQVRYNHEFYVMKHYAHFVQPGSQMLSTSGPWAGSALAFRNLSGQTVVTLYNQMDRPHPVRLKAGSECCQIVAPPSSLVTFAV